MTDAFGGHGCEQQLRQFWEMANTDVTISTVPPLVIGPYTQPGLTCPCGVTFWVEPTGEQIAEWVRDGVE